MELNRKMHSLLGFASVRPDSWDNMPSYHRRQENALTKMERDIPEHVEMGVKIPKRTVTTGISDDFTRNSLDHFERTFGLSNERIARNMVLAFNPKKNSSDSDKARAEMAYLESLEDYNLCRNCRQAIKVRTVSVSFESDILTKAEYLELNARQRKNVADVITTQNVTMFVADIAEHTEVYWDREKGGFKFRKVAKHEVRNSKCECMFAEVRKIERKENRVPAKRMM